MKSLWPPNKKQIIVLVICNAIALPLILFTILSDKPLSPVNHLIAFLTIHSGVVIAYALRTKKPAEVKQRDK